MLELRDVTYTIETKDKEAKLLQDISLEIPCKHFMAIVGPSGCGKTTLLKTLAGLLQESSGTLHWNGRNLSEEEDFEPWEIGYVPQFSIAYDELTVEENIVAAARLRTHPHDILENHIEKIIEETGLAEIADRPVNVLSGGQKRRLGLAMELVTAPKILLCDEVTSGLDPRSEREIVNLLHTLSRHKDRLVISVTHSLAHLELYDSLLVLHEGRVAYHGSPAEVTHYFSVNDTEEIYPRLTERPANEWQKSWIKHRTPYYETLHAEDEKAAEEYSALPPSLDNNHRPPGLFAQYQTLLGRRWRIFLRDRAQVMLQLAILICFPLLVAVFSERGKEPIKKLSETREENILLELKNLSAVHQNHIQVGSGVSGLIMLQVVLLALMGSNNAAREIASERPIFEKEKFGGLSPTSYLMSKMSFLGTLVFAQSLWMAFFVEFFWHFPGNFMTHLTFLLLINGSMTSICLGISALMKTAEQASLLAIYLVGFQLPLSGAVLALPQHLEAFTRPFISAYWAWSGSIEALEDNIYTAARTVIGTSLSPGIDCLYALGAHLALGLAAAWYGLQKNRAN